MIKECSIEGCSSPVLARQYCEMHYARWRLKGEPGTVEPSRNRNGTSLIQRFWSFTDRRGPDDCWPWIGSIHPTGYAHLKVQGRNVKAHRLGYELLVGPIPNGLTLDHLCHTRDSKCAGGDTCLHRRCVNPAHLEPVAQRINALRGRSQPAINATKTHCSKGHPYDESNTYINPNRTGRTCRICNNAAQRAYQQRKRGGT